MASATLRLTIDPKTGERTVTISYATDLDALPHEHEEAHRELVEQLFVGGIGKPGDTIVVEREGTGRVADVAQIDPAIEEQAARVRT